MKKFLVLALLLLPSLLWAQKFREEAVTQDEPITNSGDWSIILNYTNIYDSEFASDAISGDANYFVLTDIDASLDDFWGDATLKLGPCGSMRLNSGALNNKNYTEQNILWTLGIVARVDFPASYLQLSAQAGLLTGYFTRFSGYETKRQDFVFSTELIYESDAGRQQDETFVPAWKMSAVASVPKAPQQVIDWGYQDLTHRLGDQSTNTSSVHVLATIDLFDVPWSEAIITPTTIRGGGGKYSTDVKYLFLGAGTKILYDKKPAVGLSVDKIWGWDNSKLDNWALNLEVDLHFFQQLW